jgi:hypothetical protein
MPAATADQIRTFFDDSLGCWNKGDKEGFVAAYRAVCSTEPRFENPVGTDVMVGWEVLDTLWDQYQATITITLNLLIVNGNEACAYLTNAGEHEGQAFSSESLEAYVFGHDGSFQARYFDANHA